MRYVLDTNTVSALMNGNERVLDRLQDVPRHEVWVPQPAWAEVAFGIDRLPSSKRKTALEERRVLVRTATQCAEWTDEVTLAFGRIKATLEKRGEPIEDFDAAIAAHALAGDAVLVTADAKHMPRIPGLIIEDWSK